MDDEDGAVRRGRRSSRRRDRELQARLRRRDRDLGRRVRPAGDRAALSALADRRAPSQDKAEIANRLGWLAKETGNVRASRRYFARGRGSNLAVATYAILGITIAVSLAAALAANGVDIYRLLWLDKPLIADGQIWRLLTVALVHGDPAPEAFGLTLLHLGGNMYALYLVGPIVERLYGPVRFVGFYVVAAIFASSRPSRSATRRAAPAPRARSSASSGSCSSRPPAPAGARPGQPEHRRPDRDPHPDQHRLRAEHRDRGQHGPHRRLIAGVLLAVAFAPGKVPTLRSMWQPGSSGHWRPATSSRRPWRGSSPWSS
jgi:membrane associated rhomboid family serine protease